MLASVGQCLRLMYRIKKECEKSVTKETDTSGSPPNTVNDSDIPSLQENQSNTSNKVEPEKPTMRSSKSDSSLSVQEKQSPMSSSKEMNIDRVLSKSNFELSSPTSEPSAPFSFESTGSISNAGVTDVTAAVTPSASQVTYAIASPAPETVPYASYSSSDEEAEFFDATTDIEHAVMHKKTKSDSHSTRYTELL